MTETDPLALLTLAEAAKRINDRLTARALMTEATKGRLALTRIAGKPFVAAQDLADFLQRARNPCHAPTPVLDSSGTPQGGTDTRPSSSAGTSTEGAASISRARMISSKLKRCSRRGSQGEPESPPAQVIPLR